MVVGKGTGVELFHIQTLRSGSALVARGLGGLEKLKPCLILGHFHLYCRFSHGMSIPEGSSSLWSEWSQ